MIADEDGPGGKPLNLSQSGAIVVYAAEKSGKLLPRDAVGRAIALQWLMQAASDISGASDAVFHTEMRAPEKSAANLDYFKQRLVPYFAVCHRQLQTPVPAQGSIKGSGVLVQAGFQKTFVER